MSTYYKTIAPSDIIQNKQNLYEAIPITGSIVSGSYADSNIKNYSHGMFQSVYDYNYLSSSANPIFDITLCYSNESGLSGSANTQNSKKINLYNSLAQVLMGYDATGSVLEFDADGDLTGGTKIREAVVVKFNRIIAKDELKKGNFDLYLGVSGSYATPFAETIKVSDTGAANSYKSNAAAGEYGILYATDNTGTPLDTSDVACGLVFYQAGVALLTASVFGALLTTPAEMNSGAEVINAVLTGSTITNGANDFRHRFFDLDLVNTTKLYSTQYLCRVNHNEFNYSANPTYLNNSKVRTKIREVDAPTSYFTSVVLMSEDNVPLAVGKLSEPIKKDSNNDLTLRLRTDF
jgi:hypothetical protein